MAPKKEKYEKLTAGKSPKTDKVAAICYLLDNYLSVASLFSGKEYTFTYTNHIGVYEKLLIGPKDFSDLKVLVDKQIGIFFDLE